MFAGLFVLLGFAFWLFTAAGSAAVLAALFNVRSRNERLAFIGVGVVGGLRLGAITAVGGLASNEAIFREAFSFSRFEGIEGLRARRRAGADWTHSYLSFTATAEARSILQSILPFMPVCEGRWPGDVKPQKPGLLGRPKWWRAGTCEQFRAYGADGNGPVETQHAVVLIDCFSDGRVYAYFSEVF